jgi:transcriptional regulator with XRE-family HTH domain
MRSNRGKRPVFKEDDPKAMGRRLRAAREYLGFSQDEAASYLGVSRSALAIIESGSRKLDVRELKKLAGLYKRPITHFTGENKEAPPFGEDVPHLRRKASKLSKNDRAELGRFACFLRAMKQEKEG